MSKLLIFVSFSLLSIVVISTEAKPKENIKYIDRVRYVHINKYVGCNTTEDTLMSSEIESYMKDSKYFKKGSVLTEYDME